MDRFFTLAITLIAALAIVGAVVVGCQEELVTKHKVAGSAPEPEHDRVSAGQHPAPAAGN